MWNYTYSFSFDVFLINSNAIVESILDYYHIPFIFFPFSISQELKKKVILIIMHILFRFVYILGSLSYVYYTGNYSGSYRGHLKVISKQIRVNIETW